MAVNSVSANRASVIASAASTYIKQVAGSGGSATSQSSALAESTETPQVTAKEAAKGDPVAKRLLAKEQAAQQANNSAPAQEPGKGDLVDQKA